MMAHNLPWIVAHRAAAPGAPENSLAGIRGAAALGAAMAEIDIRYALFGDPVVIHDPWLKRTTTGRGLIRLFPLWLLRRLVLRGAGQERIPTLGEALDAAPEGFLLALDLKSGNRRGLDRVLRVVAKHGAEDRVWLWLTGDPLARRARERAPGVRVTLLTAPATTPDAHAVYLARAEAVGARGVSLPWATIDRAVADDAHRRGLLVFGNCRRPESAPETVAAGLDGIMTPDPVAVRAALAPTLDAPKSPH